MPNETPSSGGWSGHLAGNDKKVEARLGELQDRHRLAIHSFEGKDKFRLVPDATLLKDMEHNERHFKVGRAPHIKENDVALFSMTLLPAQHTGVSVTVFDTSKEGWSVSYLLNLDDKAPSPARIVTAFRQNAVTGAESNFTKSLKLDDFKDTSQFQLLADVYGMLRGGGSIVSPREAIINAAMDYPQLFTNFLDTLAKTFTPRNGSTVLPWNEVLVAATPQHVEAIAIPVSSELFSKDAFFRLNAELQGALSGLAHLRKGKDLPVVSYHVDGARQGQCRYIAQGEEECRAVALDAISKMQASSYARQVWNQTGLRYKEWDELNREVRKLVGVTIFEPLKEQGIELPREGLRR